MKKSAEELPIPMAAMEIGTPVYRPVKVKKPRSVSSLKGLGFESKNLLSFSALLGGPTIRILLAISPFRIPR